jgi:hypothetical protein
VSLFTVPSRCIFKLPAEKAKNLAKKSFLQEGKLVVDTGFVPSQPQFHGFKGAVILNPEVENQGVTLSRKSPEKISHKPDNGLSFNVFAPLVPTKSPVGVRTATLGRVNTLGSDTTLGRSKIGLTIRSNSEAGLQSGSLARKASSRSPLQQHNRSRSAEDTPTTPTSVRSPLSPGSPESMYPRKASLSGNATVLNPRTSSYGRIPVRKQGRSASDAFNGLTISPKESEEDQDSIFDRRRSITRAGSETSVFDSGFDDGKVSDLEGLVKIKLHSGSACYILNIARAVKLSDLHSAVTRKVKGAHGLYYIDREDGEEMPISLSDDDDLAYLLSTCGKSCHIYAGTTAPDEDVLSLY